MNKNMIWALVLLALVVIIAVLNRGSTEVSLVFAKVKAMTAFVFLGFTAIGVVIGVLLK